MQQPIDLLSLSSRDLQRTARICIEWRSRPLRAIFLLTKVFVRFSVLVTTALLSVLQVLANI